MKLRITSAFALLAAQPLTAQDLTPVPATEEQLIQNVMMECYFSINSAKLINNGHDPKLDTKLGNAASFYKGYLVGKGVDVNMALPEYRRTHPLPNGRAAQEVALGCMEAAKVFDLTP